MAELVQVRFEAPAPGPGAFGGPIPLDRDRLRRRAEPYGDATGYVQLVTDGGAALPPPGVVRPRVPVDTAARRIAREGTGENLTDMTVEGTHLRVLTRGVEGGGAVQVARPLTEVDEQLSGVLLILALVSVGGVALAAALGVLVARTALAPIGRFTSGTEAVAADPDVSRRMEVGSADDELSRLARSFNATLDALERSVEAQRQLVADASHELRTPMASLRANIQTLEHADRLPAHELAALRADIVEELDELTALVADVVELARGSKPGVALDDVRLDEVVAAAVDRTRSRVGGQVEIDAELEPAVVLGEPERIQRAVSNLLENAVKWSPPGSSIDVDLRGGVLDGPRPRPRVRSGRPAPRVRALLPRRPRSRNARLGAGPRDREAGRGGARRDGRGAQRRGRRRAAAAVVRRRRSGGRGSRAVDAAS